MTVVAVGYGPVLRNVALVVTAGVVGLCLVTLALAVWRRHRTQRREEAHTHVRTELFRRRGQETPGWEAWMGQLSARQRRELERVLERYLRTVSGSERGWYLARARELGMGERADAALESDALVPRLRALARLTLLDYPVTADRLLETCPDHRQTREAVARLLYERREEFDRPAAKGTALLVWRGERPMSIRGLQTCHEHGDGDPRELLLQGYWGVDGWDEAVLEQTCDVLGTCQTTVGPGWFDWVFELCDHERPQVRAASVGAFRQVGWREDFRERIPFRQLLADGPRVRRATYRVLAYWGNEAAGGLLRWAVIDESDPRAQLLAVRGLASLEAVADPDEDHPAWPDASWAWVRAELTVAERRRLPSRTGVGEP